MTLTDAITAQTGPLGGAPRQGQGAQRCAHRRRNPRLHHGNAGEQGDAGEVGSSRAIRCDAPPSAPIASAIPSLTMNGSLRSERRSLPVPKPSRSLRVLAKPTRSRCSPTTTCSFSAPSTPICPSCAPFLASAFSSPRNFAPGSPIRTFIAVALKSSASRPSSTLFIDDSAKNVAGAVAAGLVGCLYTGVEALAAAVRF